MESPSSTLELSPTEIGALPDAAQRSVVVALVAAVRADGRVDPREVVQLNAMLSRGTWDEAGVSPEAVASYFAIAETRVSMLQDRNDVVQLGRECAAAITSPAVRSKVLQAMLVLAYADGAFTPQEQGFISVFNEGFGVPQARFEAFSEGPDSVDIFGATARGRLATVQSLLDRGTPVNARDPRQWTPLHVAVATGHLDIVELLLARGADVQARHGQNSPPLFVACNKPHEAIVERLLRAGARPNDVGSDNLTALHVAAMFGQLGVAQVLVRGGARVDMVDVDGRTALHVAASGGHAQVVSFLLAAGAPVDARTSKACTALHFAASRGDAASAQALLDARAEVDARDVDGQTPLLSAASNHPDTLALLLARGARPEAASSAGVTALHVAARGGFTTCVRLLLDAGAPLEARNVQGGTPLFGAAVHGRSDAYDLLVLRGADPEAATAQGATPRGSIGAAKTIALRSVTLHTPPEDAPANEQGPRAPGTPAAALEAALAAVPLSSEAASLAAHFDDYQVAVWTGDRPGPAQVLVAGKDAHGRPIYVVASALKKHGEARARLLSLAGGRGRHWLPVFTTDEAAAAFRTHSELTWPENGLGLADAVIGTVGPALLFHVDDLPVDGVIVNPYGPGGPRVLSLEDCDRIARLIH